MIQGEDVSDKILPDLLHWHPSKNRDEARFAITDLTFEKSSVAWAMINFFGCLTPRTVVHHYARSWGRFRKIPPGFGGLRHTKKSWWSPISGMASHFWEIATLLSSWNSWKSGQWYYDIAIAVTIRCVPWDPAVPGHQNVFTVQLPGFGRIERYKRSNVWFSDFAFVQKSVCRDPPDPSMLNTLLYYVFNLIQLFGQIQVFLYLVRKGLLRRSA